MTSGNGKRIGLYASEVFDTGGIQTYMRSILKTLMANGWVSHAVSLKDPPDSEQAADWSARGGFAFWGASREKARYVVECLKTSLGTDFGVVGYATLGPVAAVQKRLGLLDGFAVVLHGIEAWEPMKPWEEWALREADAVICTTEFTAQKTIDLHGVSREAIEILPLALEPARFDVGEPSDGGAEHLEGRQLDEGPFRLVTISRLTEAHDYKGVDHTIEAMGILADRGDVGDVHFTVIGEGDDRGRLEELAHKEGVGERVEFLGRVSDARLQRAFDESDAFIMPSSGEGFGLAYVEAMANGLPCIASPEGGAQYVVRHEVSGLMAEWGNPEALADAVVRLADPTEYETLSRQARREYHERFTYRRFREDLEAILERRFSC